MRVHVCAVGRLRTGPERALIDDYTTRFDRTGRGLGLGPLTVTEVEDRKGGGMEAEATLLDLKHLLQEAKQRVQTMVSVSRAASSRLNGRAAHHSCGTGSSPRLAEFRRFLNIAHWRPLMWPND